MITVLDILDVIDQYDGEQISVLEEQEIKTEAHERLEEFYNFIDKQQKSLGE
jgi:hypothetical protein